MDDVDDRPIRHVVFNPSARGSLLQALKALGRRDEVVALFDDLRCGPLDLADLAARERWFDDVLDVGFEAGFVRQWHKEFWPKALDPDRRLVVWTTRYSAQDWIGFVVWASRLDDMPAAVIDISDVLFPDWRDPSKLVRRAVPLVTPDEIVEKRLIDLARPVSPQDRADARDEFSRLVSENGAFRSVKGGAPVSLPITAYDDRLLARASPTLRKAARIIGTLGDLEEQDGWPVGDLPLAARLCVLVEAGKLEAVGDIYGSIRYWEARLPSPRP